MGTHFDLIIKGGKALLSHRENPYYLVEEVVDIGIKAGKIAEIGSLGGATSDSIFKADGLHVLPGLIDTQVHFREPGGEHKEDINSGSRSALLGGITAFFDMPNTYPPTVTEEALNDKIQRAKGRSYCDFAFFVGAQPENVSHLKKLAGLKHCPGVKIFMGSSTGSLLLSEEEQISYVFQDVSAPIALHSEDEERLRERKSIVLSEPGKVELHPRWRDPECALKSTQKIIRLCQKHKTRVHILHVTTEEEIELLSQNQEYATVEVTPQHLTLRAPECYEELGTLAQMNPPIREERHQKALWRGVQSGVVTMLGSDHAPHTMEEKQKVYPNSPAGMPGVQTLLPIMLNHVHNQKLGLKKLVELLAINPHRFYNIKNQGLIQQGFKANLTVVDLQKKCKISQKWLAGKCGWSPFENKTVTGWPIAVLLNGKWAMKENEIIGPPQGQGLLFLDH